LPPILLIHPSFTNFGTVTKNLLDVGEPLTTISKLLGHSKVETTKIYTMPGERDLENAVDKVAWV
jgi:site-specific recombinase XerD